MYLCYASTCWLDWVAAAPSHRQRALTRGLLFAVVPGGNALSSETSMATSLKLTLLGHMLSLYVIESSSPCCYCWNVLTCLTLHLFFSKYLLIPYTYIHLKNVSLSVSPHWNSSVRTEARTTSGIPGTFHEHLPSVRTGQTSRCSRSGRGLVVMRGRGSQSCPGG